MYIIKVLDVYKRQVLSQNERIHQMKAKIDVLKKQLNIEEELSKEVFIRLLSDIIHIVEDQEKTYQKYYTEVAYLKRIQKSLEQDQICLLYTSVICNSCLFVIVISS